MKVVLKLLFFSILEKNGNHPCPQNLSTPHSSTLQKLEIPRFCKKHNHLSTSIFVHIEVHKHVIIRLPSL